LKKRIFVIFVIMALGTSNVLFAQNTATGDFTVTSTPGGAEVMLKGEATVTGISPVSFRYPLIGSYEIIVKRFGYERYSTRLNIDPAKSSQLDVTLIPKTRLKAAVRSFFVPGWGQRYTDQSSKGYVFHLLAVTTITGFLLVNDHFNEKLDVHQAFSDEYDRAVARQSNPGDLAPYANRLNKAREEAYDAENLRRISIGAVAGVWLVSVVDAIFFFPEDRGAFSIKGLSLAPELQIDKVGMTLSCNF